jgi:hypothetical protein
MSDNIDTTLLHQACFRTVREERDSLQEEARRLHRLSEGFRQDVIAARKERDRLRVALYDVMTELNLNENGPDAQTYVDGHADPVAWAKHVAELALRVKGLEDALTEAKRDAENAKAFNNGYHVRNYREMLEAKTERNAAIARTLDAQQAGADAIGKLILERDALKDALRAARRHVNLPGYDAFPVARSAFLERIDALLGENG